MSQSPGQATLQVKAAELHNKILFQWKKEEEEEEQEEEEKEGEKKKMKRKQTKIYSNAIH